MSVSCGPPPTPGCPDIAKGWGEFDFCLGTHVPSHLEQSPVRMFMSYHFLAKRRRLPRARRPWRQDSRGFTCITKTGRHEHTPREYAQYTRRNLLEVGQLEVASIQDWMCEEVALRATGLTIAEHQRRTVRSLLDLQDVAPDLPWMPVLQGWEPDDYLRHLYAYGRAGVDLLSYPLVGVGSVCRRHSGADAARVVLRIAKALPGIRIHAFGFKMTGLREVAHVIASADSLAWSYEAWKSRIGRLPECPGKHKNCANCLNYGLRWRERIALDEAIAPHFRGGPLGIEPLPRSMRPPVSDNQPEAVENVP